MHQRPGMYIEEICVRVRSIEVASRSTALIDDVSQATSKEPTPLSGFDQCVTRFGPKSRDRL